VYDSHFLDNSVSSTLIRGMTYTSIEVYNSTIRMILDDDDDEEEARGGLPLAVAATEDSFNTTPRQGGERKAVVTVMDASTLILDGMEMNDPGPSSTMVPVIVVDHSWAISIQGICLVGGDHHQHSHGDGDGDDNNNPMVIMDETCWWQNVALIEADVTTAATASSTDYFCSSRSNGGIFVMDSDWRDDEACWDMGNHHDETAPATTTTTNTASRYHRDGPLTTTPCSGFCVPLPRLNDRCGHDEEISSKASTTSSPWSGRVAYAQFFFCLVAVVPIMTTLW
jgi:hypothetical protein